MHTMETRCSCSDGLVPHMYGLNNRTMEDGYRCSVCGDFKPINEDFEDEGE